jgi:hypothetical protein
VVLTKSGFLQYRQCPKFFWLKTNRLDEVEAPAPNPFARMLMTQGYEVEVYARQLVAGWVDADRCELQVTFSAGDLEVRADLVRRHPEGDIDLFEIKSSTSVSDGSADHIDDAAFQTIVIERSGTTVRSVHIIHLNKDYVRAGAIDPAGLLIVADVIPDVRERRERIDAEIETALAFLAEPALDENGCGCRFQGNPDNHCATFDRFNPGIAVPSVYILPRISRAKLQKLDAEGRFTLEALSATELTARQALVLQAAMTGSPVINKAGIAGFIDTLQWPLHFYDYETFGSAVPLADGHKPHAQMPVQFSLHRLERNGDLVHFEHLSESPGMQRQLVEELEQAMGSEGCAISWNMSFENACNSRMATLLPDKAEFLAGVNARTCDLMKPFEQDYVDARFAGSTSIKKVLPVLVPSLAYSTTDVHDGTGAMEAWRQLVTSQNEDEKAKLRRQLLSYCRLDTLAMVEIFRALQALV